TCLGELQEEELAVRVEDASGTVLVDEARTTAPNGFLGLWLPRDRELALSLAGAAGEATATLRTDAEAPTCVTTMQLGAGARAGLSGGRRSPRGAGPGGAAAARSAPPRRSRRSSAVRRRSSA